jgi:phage host-nuclease inhibitor protein Gam
MNCNEPQTAALLATIAELTHALRLETQLADRNAELAAKYKSALENIQLWINEGLKR